MRLYLGGILPWVTGKNWQGHWIPQEVVAQWCNPLTLQPEQSGRVGLKPTVAQPLECHDKGVTDSIKALATSALLAFRTKSRNFTFLSWCVFQMGICDVTLASVLCPTYARNWPTTELVFQTSQNVFSFSNVSQIR